ncbi:hypothetical protein L873DRAFT_1840402 [Choiromyces venosus 120613-1]|uniref:Uncharacterized protein n=1 Tax=Choiromyces venosus 120613-1 TaxID=1336337 RepID=A0A3N4K254_9PEZI|nr:hypothetical protein L873DRAFT_1840402 [Choiromyces venosus 120613-1]
MNQNIETSDYNERHIGRKKRKRQKAEQIFKPKELKFTSKRGIKWVSYYEHVLPLKLCLWMKGLKDEMHISHVYLIKDNVLSHQTARQVNDKERQSHRIIALDWSSKSLDSN